MIEVKCSVCGNPFLAYPSDIKRGVKNCSRECQKKMPRKAASPEPEQEMIARFWSKVTKTDTCWIYGTKSSNYGNFYRRKVDGGPIPAHVFCFELHCGPLPKGLIVRHQCDVPGCVNPDHLLSGTYKQNSMDMVVRKRNTRSRRFSESEILSMRQAYSDGKSQSDLASEFGVSPKYINVLLHHKWKQVPGISAKRKEIVPGKKLSYEIACQIRRLHELNHTTFSDLAGQFNVHIQTIRDVISERTWTKKYRQS